MAVTADRSAFHHVRHWGAGACLAFTIAVALAACGGAASTGRSATPSGGQSALPVVSGSVLPSEATIGSLPVVGSLYVRSWFENGSVGPAGFFFMSTVVSGGKLCYEPDAPDVSPQPLYVAPMTASITSTGIAMIVGEAQKDGLLGATHDFVCAHSSGAQTTVGGGVNHLQIVVDGTAHSLSGSCPYSLDDTVTPGPNGAQPGTSNAFTDFVAHLGNVTGWLGGELGTPTQWTPGSLAVVAALPDSAFWSPDVDTSDIAQWHVGAASAGGLGTFSSFGTPFASTGAQRCGVVTGNDLTWELPSIATAHVGTVFVDSTGEQRVLAIHPLMPNEPWSFCG